MFKNSNTLCLIVILLLSFVSLMVLSSFVGESEIPANSISVNKTNNDVVISDAMNIAELIEQVAKDDGISRLDAQKQLGFTNAMSRKALDAKAQYRAITSQFTVNRIYRPSVKLYCETTESGGLHAIKKILEVNMNRNYKYLSKQFGGTIFANLEDPNTIFYIVNGDFYTKGTTIATTEASVGVSSGESATFDISSASQHYKYAYVEKRVSF